MDFLAGKQESLLSMVRQCKLSWLGHINQHNAVSRVVLQGTMEARTEGLPEGTLAGQHTGMDQAQQETDQAGINSLTLQTKLA